MVRATTCTDRRTSSSSGAPAMERGSVDASSRPPLAAGDDAPLARSVTRSGGVRPRIISARRPPVDQDRAQDQVADQLWLREIGCSDRDRETPPHVGAPRGQLGGGQRSRGACGDAQEAGRAVQRAAQGGRVPRCGRAGDRWLGSRPRRGRGRGATRRRATAVGCSVPTGRWWAMKVLVGGRSSAAKPAGPSAARNAWPAAASPGQRAEVAQEGRQPGRRPVQQLAQAVRAEVGGDEAGVAGGEVAGPPAPGVGRVGHGRPACRRGATAHRLRFGRIEDDGRVTAERIAPQDGRDGLGEARERGHAAPVGARRGLHGTGGRRAGQRPVRTPSAGPLEPTSASAPSRIPSAQRS